MSNYQAAIDRYISAHFVVTKGISAWITQITPQTLTNEQYQVLGVLYERKCCTSTELAEVFMVGKSSITAIITRLVEHGYVERASNTQDRRQIYLSLTKLGEEIFKESEAKLFDMISKVLVHFSADEIELFVSKYEKLAQIIGEGDHTS